MAPAFHLRASDGVQLNRALETQPLTGVINTESFGDLTSCAFLSSLVCANTAMLTQTKEEEEPLAKLDSFIVGRQCSNTQALCFPPATFALFACAARRKRVFRSSWSRICNSFLQLLPHCSNAPLFGCPVPWKLCRTKGVNVHV